MSSAQCKSCNNLWERKSLIRLGKAKSLLGLEPFSFLLHGQELVSCPISFPPLHHQKRFGSGNQSQESDWINRYDGREEESFSVKCRETFLVKKFSPRSAALDLLLVLYFSGPGLGRNQSMLGRISIIIDKVRKLYVFYVFAFRIWKEQVPLLWDLSPCDI